MEDAKKKATEQTAEESEETKAPVSEICGNAEENAAALVDDDLSLIHI